MADFSAFSNTSFDINAWVNGALNERPEEDGLEAYLASLAMKLHILSQDYTDQLETGMVEAMSAMPRVLSDISHVEDLLHNVETEMESLAYQIKAFDQRNVSGVEDLSRLDTVKLNMEKCKSTLEEHARWSQLVREAKTFLESGGRVTESADRIETMGRSLKILENMPGNSERLETYDGLSNSLLMSIRSSVRRDVAILDMTTLHDYLYVYDKLDRRSELVAEYVRARPERLKGTWNNYSKHLAFPPWLATFYGKVAGLLQDEASNVEQLFGSHSSCDILAALLSEALDDVIKPLCERLQSLNDSVMAAECYDIADEFTRRTVGHFVSSNNNNNSNNNSNSSGVVLVSGTGQDCLQSVLSTIYGGFMLYINVYGEVEGEFVRAQLATVLAAVSFTAPAAGQTSLDTESELTSFTFSDDHQESLSMLWRYSESLVKSAGGAAAPVLAALRRAARIMGGVRAKAVFRAVSAALASFVKQLTGKVEDLRTAIGMPVSESSTVIGQSDSNQPAEDREGAGVGSKSEDIARRLGEGGGGVLELSAVLPSALRAVQAAGRMSRSVAELEAQALGVLHELSASVFRETACSSSGSGSSSASSSLERSVTQAIASNSSIGAAFVTCVLPRQDAAAASELRSFLVANSSMNSSKSSQSMLLSATAGPLNRLRAAGGLLLFDLCTTAPQKMLSDYHTEDMWSDKTSSESETGAVSVSVAEMAEGLLPLPAVTQVGEHLLSLVQELEVFAASDALPDLQCLSGEALQLTLRSSGWTQLRKILELKEDGHDGVDSLCRRGSCEALVTAAEQSMFGCVQSVSVSGQTLNPTACEGAEDAGGLGMSFVNEWLGAIADAVVGLLLTQVGRIARLSVQGSAQLTVDLDYMGNVLNAMGLRPHPLLCHVKQVLMIDHGRAGTIAEQMPARTSGAIALQKLIITITNAREHHCN